MINQRDENKDRPTKRQKKSDFFNTPHRFDTDLDAFEAYLRGVVPPVSKLILR